MNLTREQELLRTDRGAMEREIKAAGGNLRGKSLRCIFHDDHAPSAGIFEGEGGAWKYKCHGCGFSGDVFDVRAKLSGKTVAEELAAVRESPTMPVRRTQMPAEKPATIYPTVEAIAGQFTNVEGLYQYTNPDTGAVDMAVVRYRAEDGKKRFVQCRPEAGGFVMKAPEGRLPIYNRMRIAKANTVVVVEGEKCVHALHDAGVVATTSPGGALKGDKADWSPLAGKNVILWPDNDAPEDAYPYGKGVEHMRQVQRLIEQLTPAPRLWWLDPKSLDLPAKGDAADLVARCATAQEKRLVIQAILDDAEPMGVAGELRKRLEETIAGKRRAIPIGDFGGLSYASRALMPGTVTCFCGDPGSTKSILLLQAAQYWHAHGFKVALYELEEDRTYHLQRALAQREGLGCLTDPDWIELNPDESRAAVNNNVDFLDGFGRCIWEAPDEQVSLEMLADWVRERARAGCEIIAIDPITAAEADEKPWIADLQFLMSVKTTARRYGCRVVLVTHPKKGNRSGKGLDDLAGGAAYQRFSQTVLWIERFDEPKDVRVRPFGGIDTYTRINRAIRIRKARNGHGAGSEIGFYFDGGTLRFQEAGIVIPTPAGAE